MKIAFVTGSRAKYQIAAEHLHPFGIELEHVALDLIEIQSVSVEQIARHKAAQAFEVLGRACMVEDSGFGIDELGGYPGTNVKHLITAAGPAAVARLADLTTTRACTSTAALVYVDHTGNSHTFTNTRPGTIAVAPQGEGGKLALWTVYCPPGSDLPLAAMTPEHHKQWQDWWAANSVFAQCGRWLAANIGTGTPADRTAPPTEAVMPFVQAAAGLLIRDRHIVLVCQDRGDGPVWSPPGAGVEPGELLAEAVTREVLEETGLSVRTVGPLAYLVNTTTRQHPSALIVFFAINDWHGDTDPRDPDIAGCRLVPFAEAITLLEGSPAPRRETEPLIAHLRGSSQALFAYRDDRPVPHA